MAVNGGPAGALLLKLKILTGEPEPDVLAECFSGLLAAAPERSLPMLAGFVNSEYIAIAEAALLALGSSRLPEALEVLKTKWVQTAGPLRKTVLLAIGMVRSDAAVEFLLGLLADCTQAMAKDVFAGLALFRDNEKIRSRVEIVVASRNEKSITELFGQQF